LGEFQEKPVEPDGTLMKISSPFWECEIFAWLGEFQEKPVEPEGTLVKISSPFLECEIFIVGDGE